MPFSLDIYESCEYSIVVANVFKFDYNLNTTMIIASESKDP